MPENAKKPQIRFKGFTDAWEQRKLNEINTFFTDGNYGEAYPKQSDLSDSTNGIPFLTGGNLKNGILDLTGASYITKEKHKKLMSGHLLEDDIVIAVRGSLGALGYVTKKNVDWNINSQLAILRTDKERLIGSFLIQYLLSENAQNDFLSLMTGSALKQLPISQLKNLVVPVTLIHEQELIAQLFNRVDNLITLRQRKLDKLKNIKKSMLEKMFPKNGSNVPEIRFKGFTDAWEQRKLSNIAEKTFGGGTPTTSNNTFWSGTIPWIQSSDITDGKLTGVIPKKYITQNGLNNSTAQLVPQNSIAVITRVGVGKLALMPFSYTTSQDFLSLSRLNTEPLFTAYSCYKKLQSELNTVQGTSIKGITKDELLTKIIWIPKYNEQVKISEILKNLDNLITLHQRKIKRVLHKYTTINLFVR